MLNWIKRTVPHYKKWTKGTVPYYKMREVPVTGASLGG